MGNVGVVNAITCTYRASSFPEAGAAALICVEHIEEQIIRDKSAELAVKPATVTNDGPCMMDRE